MEFEYLEKLKQTDPTLKLLHADNAPLIISFIHKAFIAPNNRSMAYSDLASLLNDYLYHLREIYGNDRCPRSAKDYLDAWSSPETPFLRKYYPSLSDEPQIAPTPAAEKAIEWLQSLEKRRFIGAESRLLIMFQLLRDIVFSAEYDPEARIAQLEQQKTVIDAEIEKIRREGVGPYDPTRARERFFQAEETARRLLADFRQVEHNFRTLDRETRERIAASDKAKGALLDEIFHDQDVIWSSDQGKSFRAFWEFLMSPAHQEELRQLLDRIFELGEIRELNRSDFLPHIKFYLLDAGEQVYKTTNMLVEQLRKFLDSQAYLENRRIMELIRRVEKRAIEIKHNPPPERAFAELDDVKPTIELLMSRGLFVVPKNPSIAVEDLAEGVADIEISSLYEQCYIDEEALKSNIRKALRTQSQISLAALLEQYPVEKGLMEIVAYLNLASKNEKAMILEDEDEAVFMGATSGASKWVRLPKVIFTR